MTDERPCIRGCTYRDSDDTVPASHGSLLCDRCLQRLRRTLQDAPDLLGHLRSLVDPQKAQVYDEEKPGGRPASSSRPPMSADLVDAADAVLETLVYWARYFGDTTDYKRWTSLPAGAGPVRSHGAADWAAQYLLMNLERIGNDSLVRLFAGAVLDVPRDPEPQEHVEWTIAKALQRWPLEERPKFAKLPCPGCELRGVLVRPPRREGQERTYECKGCGWVPPILERELWAMYFEAGVLA